MNIPAVQSSYPDEAEIARIAALQDGAVRNQQITAAYWHLSAEIERRIRGHANWCTFACWASQQAGVTIRHQDMTHLLRQRLQSSWRVTGIDLKLIGMLVEAKLDLMQLVVNAIANLGPIRRTGDAVARGNRKVFAEIGLLFARWLTLLPDLRLVTDSEMDRFNQGLKAGPPPDGQDVLMQAFNNYRAAAQSVDPKEKAEFMFLANLQIGFHEQTRLQPDIKSALDGALLEPGDLTDLLLNTLTGHEGKIAQTLEKAFQRHESPLGKVAMVLAQDVQHHVRTLITELLMSIWLPPDTMVRLGHDLARPFPVALQNLSSPDLLRLLESFDPAPGSKASSHVKDWANLHERLRFIANLFRAYGEEKCLFEPLKAGTAAVDS
jgi:hypothetical protein